MRAPPYVRSNCMAYISDIDFKLRALIPKNVLDEIEADNPGWLDAQIAMVSEEVNARLAKRYQVPFTDPVPAIIGQWITHIVSMNAWLKRGMSAGDESFAEYKAKADRAYEEMREASDAELGLFELPRVVNNQTLTAISRGNPRVYSEQSPYVAFDRQARTARSEDGSSNGSTQ